MNNLSFDVAPDLQALIPVVSFRMSGLHNRKTDPDFEDLLARSWEQVRALYTPNNYKADLVLEGFRELHWRAECGNTRTIAAPENLLRLFLETGRFPRINLLVDLYNLVSLQTRLALGAHDAEKITGGVHLRRTTGQESFQPLGSREIKEQKAGEYAYVDDGNQVLCRLEIRQGEKSQVTLDTTECLYIVQGNPATGSEYVWTAAQRLMRLIQQFCGGREQLLYVPAEIDANSP